MANDPQWVRYMSGGRERWNYVTWGYNDFTHGTLRYHLGYITKKKNKHRCRDWLVYSQSSTSIMGFASPYGEYICTLKDMKPDEAKHAAQLILGARS